MRGVAATAALLLAVALPARADAPPALSVDYAGSLAAAMQGPIAEALRASGMEVAFEPGGSAQIEALIEAGRRTPDVFISSDRALVDKLGDRVASATTFATTRLGVGWLGKSNYAYVFESVGKGEEPLLVALAQPGLRIGRTDPTFDPKGQLTIDAVTLLFTAANEKRILGVDENPAQIYSEVDLLGGLERGEIDVAFVYEFEAKLHYLEFMPLPGQTSMSDKISFTLAIMKNAQHPAQAQAFADFILKGPGREILEKDGLRYLTPAEGSR